MSNEELHENLEVTAVDALPGAVGEPTVGGLPEGYVYGVTRYADIILQGAFSGRLANIVRTLADFRVSLEELRAGGGGRSKFVARFDQSSKDQREAGEPVWGKRNITITKQLFGLGGTHPGDHFPGVAVEMEWNNKDPFYDRDLNNYAALHREGAIASESLLPGALGYKNSSARSSVRGRAGSSMASPRPTGTSSSPG